MRGIVFIAALFFAPWIWAQPYEPDNFLRYSYTFQNGQIVERGIFAVDVPGIDEFERDRPQFNTYPQFLDYLFKQAPSLKNHFVILHHSASLQTASVEHPRVILFDGGKAFGLAEHPTNRELKVEIIEASPQDYSLKMSEITFSREGGVKIERNPKACIACHGSPAKMLWDPYDFWPQAFGSSVGAMSSVQETAAYDKMRALAPNSEILKRLNLLPKIEIGSGEENTPFTQFVGQINLAGQFKRWLNSKDLNGWRFPLISILSSCHSQFSTKFEEAKPSLLELFRPEERADLERRLDRMYTDLSQARTHMKKFQSALLSSYFPNPDITFPIDHERLKHESVDLAMIRAVLDSAGFNLNNLSTSHMANDYFVANPGNFLLDATAVLMELKPDLFAGLKLSEQSLGTGKTAWVTYDCEQVRNESLKAQRSAPAPSQWSPMASYKRERPVINRCAKCHTESTRGPLIPFDDSLKLAEFLRDPTQNWAAEIIDRVERSGRGQMPPGNPLTPEEIDSVREMIKAFR